MEKKLLILGSDCGSVDVARRAKEKGLYVVVSDLMETSPTKELADERWLISTTDIDALALKCREAGISAVITGASDFNIGNSRKLCKELGLPVYCSNDYAWEVANNKRLFKDECKRAGVRVAEDYYLTDELSPGELSCIKYPVVVKPVDKCGNLGMSYCSNEQELVAAYRKARSVSENATIVVERQLHGPEFYINYVVANGKASLYFFTSEHNQPGYPANLYSLIFTNSAHLPQWLREMNDKVIEVFERIGLTEGQAWVETILDEDGSFYLLEMGYRWGGEMLYVPYERISGFDSLSWMIECAFGVEHVEEDLPGIVPQPCKSVAAAYYLFVENSGTISRLEGVDELEAMDGVFVDLPKRLGGEIRPGISFGRIRVCAGDIEKLCELLAYINDVLVCENELGQDMIVRFTDYDALRARYYQGIREFNGEKE